MVLTSVFITSLQQQIIPADQLVTTKYQGIRRCNNYVVLQNIACPKECKIVGQLLVDHALSYALTTTADVPSLPVETPKNPFIALATLKFIQPFLKIVGYQGNVDKKKDVIQYPCFTKLIIADLIKKFPSIPQKLKEDYHSIKDDIPLYKEYEKVFIRVDIPMIQPQPVESTQETNRTPNAHRTPTPTAVVDDVAKKKKRKQVTGESSSPRKSLKVTIKQKKPSTTLIPPPSDDRERDEIAKATLLTSEFTDSVFLNEEEDFGTRLEPRSHKKNPKTVDDDDDDDE
ncbi:hypothetical protein Tco_1426052 [Tanacetum coccineum]